jgi:hypothetical protein
MGSENLLPGALVFPFKNENQDFAQDSRFTLCKTRSRLYTSRVVPVKKAVAISPTRIPPVFRINRRNPSTSSTNVDSTCCMSCLFLLASSAIMWRYLQVCDKRITSLVHKNVMTCNHISAGHAYSNFIFCGCVCHVVTIPKEKSFIFFVRKIAFSIM